MCSDTISMFLQRMCTLVAKHKVWLHTCRAALLVLRTIPPYAAPYRGCVTTAATTAAFEVPGGSFTATTTATQAATTTLCSSRA